MPGVASIDTLNLTHAEAPTGVVIRTAFVRLEKDSTTKRVLLV